MSLDRASTWIPIAYCLLVGYFTREGIFGRGSRPSDIAGIIFLMHLPVVLGIVISIVRITKPMSSESAKMWLAAIVCSYVMGFVVGFFV